MQNSKITKLGIAAAVLGAADAIAAPFLANQPDSKTLFYFVMFIFVASELYILYSIGVESGKIKERSIRKSSKHPKTVDDSPKQTDKE